MGIQSDGGHRTGGRCHTFGEGSSDEKRHRSSRRDGQSLLQVVDDVLGILDPHADANVLRRHARAGLFAFGQLLVGRAGGVNDQRFRIADIGQVRTQLARIDELLARFQSALDAEAQDRALAIGQILLSVGVVGAGFQSRVIDPINPVVRFQELGNGQSVFAVPWHSQVQCFQTLQEQESRERVHRRTGVSQPVGANVQVVGDVAHRTQVFFENRTVV